MVCKDGCLGQQQSNEKITELADEYTEEVLSRHMDSFCVCGWATPWSQNIPPYRLIFGSPDQSEPPSCFETDTII